MATPAFWLPGLPEIATEPWPKEGTGTTVELLRPVLTPDLVRRQVDALLAARDRTLYSAKIEDVLAAVDAVAARFADPRDPLRAEALDLLPRWTALSPEMVRVTLDRMAADWRRPRLERLLAEELGAAAAVDGFAELRGTGRRVHAVGPRLVFHVFSGNVPGVAVTSLVRALLVKGASLGKTAGGEPVLPALFARALAEHDPRLGECVAVAYWPGGTPDLEAAAMSAAEAVVVYGSSEAVASIRQRAPEGARLLEYPNRVSFALIAREALAGSAAAELAADAAIAASMFDQQGCVSPHLVYVEEGGETSPAEWARLLAARMAEIERALPRGQLPADEAAAIQQVRGRAEAAALIGSGAAMHASSPGTAWTVLYEPDPGFEPSCLNRVVRVKPTPSIDHIPDLLRPYGGVAQTVGVAGPEDRLSPVAIALAQLGVTRITPIVDMPWPRPWWHHDGRPPLGDLVRWCDWE